MRIMTGQGVNEEDRAYEDLCTMITFSRELIGHWSGLLNMFYLERAPSQLHSLS